MSEQTPLEHTMRRWDEAREARLEAERGQTTLTTEWAERRDNARNREKDARKPLLKMGPGGKQYVRNKIREAVRVRLAGAVRLHERLSNMLPEMIGEPIPDILPADTPENSDLWWAFNEIKTLEVEISELKAELDEIDDP